MKKRIIPALVLSITFLGFIIGCTKDISDAKLKDPAKLSEDKAFIEFTTKTYDYLLFLSKTVKSSSLSMPDMQKKLSKLQNENLPFTEQMNNIDIIFKAPVSKRLKEHMEMYKSDWDKIKSKYSTISQEVLEKECAEVLSNKYKKQSSITPNTVQRLTDPVDCGWRFYLCGGAATAGAVVCHASCDATAIATTAGLGIPACVALCGMMQAYALVVCADTYCPNQISPN